MELLSPVAEQSRSGLTLAPRMLDLRGKTIGFVDNGWWCLDVLYRDFDMQLREVYGVTRTIRKHKATSHATSPANFEELAKECHGIICGLGN